VFQALDFVPRKHFLGAVIESVNGLEEACKKQLSDLVENAHIRILSHEYYLCPSRKAYQDKVAVQPDVLIETLNTLVLVEAKRIRPSSFQREQLARELVVLAQQCGEKTPILLLVLGEAPPVKVERVGRVGVSEAVRARLRGVFDRTENVIQSWERIDAMVDGAIGWVTWRGIAETIKAQLTTFHVGCPSTEAATRRVADTLTNAVARHS
jgi:hypothetical protein